MNSVLGVLYHTHSPSSSPPTTVTFSIIYLFAIHAPTSNKYNFVKFRPNHELNWWLCDCIVEDLKAYAFCFSQFLCSFMYVLSIECGVYMPKRLFLSAISFSQWNNINVHHPYVCWTHHVQVSIVNLTFIISHSQCSAEQCIAHKTQKEKKRKIKNRKKKNSN